MMACAYGYVSVLAEGFGDAIHRYTADAKTHEDCTLAATRAGQLPILRYWFDMVAKLAPSVQETLLQQRNESTPKNQVAFARDNKGFRIKLHPTDYLRATIINGDRYPLLLKPC